MAVAGDEAVHGVQLAVHEPVLVVRVIRVAVGMSVTIAVGMSVIMAMRVAVAVTV